MAHSNSPFWGQWRRGRYTIIVWIGPSWTVEKVQDPPQTWPIPRKPERRQAHSETARISEVEHGDAAAIQIAPAYPDKLQNQLFLLNIPWHRCRNGPFAGLVRDGRGLSSPLEECACTPLWWGANRASPIVVRSLAPCPAADATAIRPRHSKGSVGRPRPASRCRESEGVLLHGNLAG